MRKYYALMSLLLLFSCAKKVDNYNQKEVFVDYSKLQDYILTSEFADTIQLIPLETNNECLIGKIEKICFSEDCMFISDSKTRSVYKFDLNGKYLGKIKHIGRGPGEYMNIDNIYLNRKDSVILLWDLPKRTLFCYDFDGKYKGENKISEWARDFMPICDNCYLGYNFNDEGNGVPIGLFLIDNKGVFKNYLYDSNQTYNNYVFENSIQKITDRLFSVCLRNESSVYQYRCDSLPSILRFRFSDLKTCADVDLAHVSDKDVDAVVFSFDDSKRYCFIKWRNAITNTSFVTCYDRYCDKVIVASGIVDVYSHLFGNRVSFEGLENVIVEVVDAFNIRKNIENSAEAAMIPKIVHNVKLEDNPIIKIIKLKK